MVMGTCSSAGKSLVTTALCRCLSRRGLRVAPFKSQNMSNNAAVCPDGGEIGRSQALQAIAAGVEPETDMNPVLLKPEGESRSQVVVNGKATPALEAREYFRQRHKLWPVITDAMDRLRSKFDYVVIEGAGSPAELNLASVEMVNLSIARYCKAPTILVGDIERGGVFAQLLGTLWLIPEVDRSLFCGMLVNKFRGDRSLFDSGVEILEERSSIPVLGVLPWLAGLNLPEEDAVALNETPLRSSSMTDSCLDIVVIHLPRIANFDDFDPLATEEGVRLRYARTVEEIGQPDVLILPGTKNTIGDLQWLSECGIAAHIAELADQGVQIVGICGGYQILGKSIENPDQLESDVQQIQGLGLLEVTTCYRPTKRTRQASFVVIDDIVSPGASGQTVSGYEIHVGQSETSRPWLRESSHPEMHVDGAYARNGQVWGCYLHGLFANDEFRRAFLVKLNVRQSSDAQSSAQIQLHESLDRLADAFEASVDVTNLINVMAERAKREGASHV
ncbi:MAG: cobyric acid synthase [Planctomycetota bacterium]